MKNFKILMLSMAFSCQSLPSIDASDSHIQKESNTLQISIAIAGTALAIFAALWFFKGKDDLPEAQAKPNKQVDAFTLETYKQMLQRMPNPKINDFEDLYKSAEAEDLSQICDVIAEQMRKKWGWDPKLEKFVS